MGAVPRSTARLGEKDSIQWVVPAGPGGHSDCGAVGRA